MTTDRQTPRELPSLEALFGPAACVARAAPRVGSVAARAALLAPPLEPDLADINRHLQAIFSPDFVKDHPEAWIEIAIADPAAGKGKTGPKAARHFSVFELASAAAYAVRINKQGRNVYVGMALRRGGTGPSGRASKDNVITASRGWADFDKPGDAARIRGFLQQHGLQESEVIQTGSIPHIRLQVFFKLEGPATPDELEAVNAALRDQLGGNGDGVQNCDRVMRLAGTVSYPPPNKVERGYVPELTKLISNPNALAYRPAALIGLLEGTSGPKAIAAAGGLNGSSPGGAGGLNGGSPGDDGKKFWRRVNDLALANLGAWVPTIFPDAEFQQGTKAYRISSDSLSRDLEEDLSIHPKGITDWGLDDQGKPGEKAGRRTAIDIVIEHGGAPDFKAAAFWLCERCDVDPATLGWNNSGKGDDGGPVGRLAQLPLLKYDQERKAAAKELGIRVSVLDSLVGQMREDTENEDVADQITVLNADHALVLAGNKAAVMKFNDATRFRLLQVGAFKQWFSNQLITIGKDVVSLGEYWMGHAERRQYAGIEFAPPGAPASANYYNLWQGFTVEPREGDCSKFLAHIKDNAARGDEATYLWIVGWWAAIVQQPSIKMETGLAFRGEQGTGKTKIGEVFGSLIRSHYLLAASPRYVTGQFNSHMASLLVLHADEAFWAGDKKSEGTLKDLVSGKNHMLEYKGIDAIEIRNFIRLFVTSNHDWIVPAGFRDRRWAIFDMGEDCMQDHAYFAAIDQEMDNGGREALLHHLLNFDLEQVDLRTVPKTAALLDQQLESMTPEQDWWFEVLTRGMLPPRPHGVNEPGVCLKDALFDLYVLHARTQGISRRATETRIGMFLRKQLGAKLRNMKPLIHDKRIHCYGLPPLKECRKRFAAKLGQPVDWGSEEEKDADWQESDGSGGAFVPGGLF